MPITRVYQPERPGAGRLGRYVFHDSRSRQYAYRAGTTKLRTVIHERFVPIWDQGDLGMCTGAASAGALGTAPLYTAAGKPELSLDVARGIYAAATAIDEFAGTYPPQDTGSSGLAVAKILHKRGHISGYSHAFSVDDALAALVDGPVIAGVNWYSSFDTPDADGYLTLSAGAVLRGGHEICLSGVDVDRRAVQVTNSWGEEWGLGGRAWMPWDLLTRLLREQGDVTILRPAAAPAAPKAGGTRESAALAKALVSGGWARRLHVGQTAKVAAAGRAWLTTTDA